MKNLFKILGIDAIFTLVDLSIFIALIKAIKVTDIPSILLAVACFIVSIAVQWLLAKRLARKYAFASLKRKTSEDEDDDEDED